VDLVVVVDIEVQLVDLAMFQELHHLKEIMADLLDQGNRDQVVVAAQVLLEEMDQQVQEIMLAEMVA
jgi:hypothetical protein